MREVHRNPGYITYTLNILGIRVWQNACQLIAKHNDEWVEIGSIRDLPIPLPEEPAISPDPLTQTVRQYELLHPGSDLRDVLEGRLSFADAMSSRSRSSSLL